MRNALLEAMEGRAQVRFESPVKGIRLSAQGDAELLGCGDLVLGVYDAVVDTSGIGSPLRAYNIEHPEVRPGGPAITRTGMIHNGVDWVYGVIPEPEVSLDPKLVDMLREGTLMVAGSRSYFILQRFGAATEDKRTAFMYMFHSEDGPGALRSEIGASNRWSTDQSALRSARAWVSKHMGLDFPQMYHEALDAVMRVSLHSFFQSAKRPTFIDHQLPLVLLGDALHAVPHRGGKEAMLDVVAAAEYFDKALHHSGSGITVSGLRSLEARCMKRTAREMLDDPSQGWRWLVS